MNGIIPSGPTHQLPDLSIGLERTKMWLRASVNPFDGHKLITQAQAEHLETLRGKLVRRFPGSGTKQWAEFETRGKPYLSGLQEEETIVSELNRDLKPEKPFTTDIFLKPTRMDTRARTQHISPKPSSERSLNATGEMLDLYRAFKHFTQAHQLDTHAIGAACIGKRTQKPVERHEVNYAVSQLGRGVRVGGIFHYIAENPDRFFGSLEKHLAARNGSTNCTIGAEERSELCQTIKAAIRQHQEQLGSGRG